MNWDDLIASALIGSARRPLNISADPSALGELSSKLATSSPEAQLLSAAALTSLYRKAGQSALSLPASELQPAPQNSLPECSSRLAHIFEQICTQNDYSNLLPEFCAGLKQQNRVLHRSMLVRALKTLRQYSGEKRQALIEILGERGYWLMQYEERVSKLQPLEAIDLDDEALVQSSWETSSHTQRLTLLAQLRQHEPARARELLRSNWLKESAQDRAELLATLQLGLSMQDEPLLEEALDNRSQTVRNQAAELLARLPESRMSERMLARARQYIKLKEVPAKGLTGKIAKLFSGNQKVPFFGIELPPQDDKTLQRDGIDGKQTVYGMGAGAGALMQLIAATPLDYWTESGFDQATLIKAAQHDDWSKAIISGWVQATLRQANRSWAQALTEQPLVVSQLSQHGSLSELLALLPKEQQEALAIAVFNQVKENKKLRDVLQQFMSAVERPWSAAFTDGVFEHLREVVSSKERYNNLFNYYQLDWLAAIDIERARYWLPYLNDMVQKQESFIQNLIEKYYTFYEFRNHMLEELSR